ncbi:MAG: MinD/ParA family protein [Acidobacteriota bacterium]
MIDQATELRKHVERLSCEGAGGGSPRCQVIAITSGKGGVGKTYVVVNLAIALQRAGKRVAILDGDFGLANVDVQLGLTPQYHLGHVIEGVQTLRSIIVTGPEGIHIIPASSGIQELAIMGERRRQTILGQLNELLREYDFILIDTAAGISDNVIRMLNVSRRVVVVCAPEPTAIVDAYALIKVLMRRDKGKEVLLLVNSVQGSGEAEEVHKQLSHVVERFLGCRLGYLGSIPRDTKVPESVRRQTPVLISYPKAMVSRNILKIAEALMKRPPVLNELNRLLEYAG